MSKKMQKESAKPTLPRKTTKPTSSSPKTATLDIGDRVSPFALPQAGGGTVSLSDFAGQKLVLFFYPRAGTPGCTVEAASFSRLAGKFAAADTALLGVSADPLKTIDAFHKKNLLKIPLVTDELHSTLNAFGVWDKKSMYGKVFFGIVRSTFLIGKTGRVLQIWRKVKVAGHAEEVLAAAKAAET